MALGGVAEYSWSLWEKWDQILNEDERSLCSIWLRKIFHGITTRMARGTDEYETCVPLHHKISVSHFPKHNTHRILATQQLRGRQSPRERYADFRLLESRLSFRSMCNDRTRCAPCGSWRNVTTHALVVDCMPSHAFAIGERLPYVRFRRLAGEYWTFPFCL